MLSRTVGVGRSVRGVGQEKKQKINNKRQAAGGKSVINIFKIGLKNEKCQQRQQPTITTTYRVEEGVGGMYRLCKMRISEMTTTTKTTITQQTR